MKAKEIKKENQVEETKAEEMIEVTEVHVGDYADIRNETEKLKFADKHPKIAKAGKIVAVVAAAVGLGALGYAAGKSKNDDVLRIDVDNKDYDDEELLRLAAENLDDSEEISDEESDEN